MTGPAIATHALTRMYGPVAALRAVTLSVQPGSVYAMVGPNGAGKTTLIQLLMNLQPPTSGSAEMLGMPSAQIRGASLRRIGYVSETQEMPDAMTVFAFLNFLRPFYPTWDRALEKQLMDDFALPPARELRHLSRGMRMKAAFVGALSYRPALLILDEPFSGLDPLVRDELIQGLLDRIGETTIFLSSHDLAEIETFASNVGYLERGSLIFSEEMDTLINRFRQIAFRIDRAASQPKHLPASWLEIEYADARVRFKDSAFASQEDSVARIRSVFPSAGEFAFEPLSLRSIFLAHARTSRDTRHASGPGAAQ
jgi:ABC-2 type transport system ATP-binding protein